MGNHALNGTDGFVKRIDYFTVDPFSIIRADILKRENYGDENDIELKNNIAANGVKEPLKVQKHDDDKKLYLVNGSRRLWCCDRLKEEGIIIPSVPVILVDKKLSPSELLFEALSSNTGKALTPLEEAEAFRRQRAYGHDVKYIAERVGKSVPFVYDRLQLVNAASEVREGIKNGSINTTTAAKAIRQAGGDPGKQAQAIHKASVQKKRATIGWDKKTQCLISKGFTDEQESVIAELMPRGFTDKLSAVGLDPETLKFSVAVKV